MMRGIEMLLISSLMMLALGPGTVVYGLFVVMRRRVQAARKIALQGGVAVAAGLGLMIVGCATTWFFWRMAAYFPE